MTQTQRTGLLIVGLLIFVGVIAFLQLRTVHAPTVNQLPVKRPDDLIISFSISAGMLPRGSSAYLSVPKSYTESYFDKIRNTTSFTVTPEELDTLYQILLSHHFDKITHTTQEVSDAGGGSIAISWATTTVSQRFGDDIVMSKEDEAAMDVIWQALQSLVQKKMAALSVPVKISLASNIPSKAQVEVMLDESPNLFSLKPAAHFIPGDHILNATVILDSQTSYTLEQIVRIPNKPTTISLSLKNKQLLHTVR